MFYVAFQVLCFALFLGVAVSIAVYVPCCILVIPYSLWLGVQNNKGKYKDLKDAGFWRHVKNAFKLYGSWITKKDLTF